jgi:hypothetical protein
MMPIGRMQTGGLLLLLSLALAACLFMPGKFTSVLDVRRDGAFSFSYTGQIFLLPLTEPKDDAANEPFAPHCYRPTTGPDDEARASQERPCTRAEVAEQKRDWDEARRTSEGKRKRDAEQMKTLFGGLDMSDPKGPAELAARLRRQAGWRRVEYKGNGLFDVDFAITGTLDRDFTFPTFEQFPLNNAFVQLSRRKDGTVRIDAPGFGPPPGGEPFRSWGQAAALGGEQSASPTSVPAPDGTFTVTTDAAILANNTDEGARDAQGGQTLVWPVNLRSRSAPMALLRLVARP